MKMTPKFFVLAALGGAVLSMSACEANLNGTLDPSVPNASASASAEVDSSTSTDASTGAGVSVDANANVSLPDVSLPGSSSSSSSSSSSTFNPNAPLKDNGALTVTGADLFNKYNLEYTKGMKWVYGMKTAVDISASIPGGLPAGFEIPGLGGGGSSTDLGSFTLEVIDVDGEFVTLQNTVNITAGPAAGPMEPTQTTVKKESFSKAYVEAFQQAGNGTLAWSSSTQSESISVPAGTYTTDVITGKANVVLETSTTALEQDIKLWMASDVGMVKEEVTSKVAGTNSTTVIELQSFSK